MYAIVTESLNTVIVILFQVIKATWWVVIPVVIFLRIKPLWLTYKGIQYSKTKNWIVLEVTLPPEVEKTPKAMENVLAGLHGVWKSVSARDKWTKGVSVDTFSLELAGIDGELHFYFRCQDNQRQLVESKIYSQYPDAEIHQVQDYITSIPPQLPNKDYEMWAADYILTRDWAYPITTHIEFEDPEQERRLDPLSQFAELVSKMDSGEYMWVQVIIRPVLSEVAGKAQEKINEEVGRKAPKKVGVWAEISSFVKNINNYYMGRELTGRPGAESAEKSDTLKLTPGEQEKVKRMEMKASKVSFSTTIRVLYVARKDVFHKGHIPAVQGFFNQFSSGFNSFKPTSTPSGSLIFFKGTRNFIRRLKLVNAYRGRGLGWLSEPYVLSVEELATIYHYPGRVVTAPFMPRISSRSSEPPKGLPR
ncbi:MAG: hypothetical protein A3A00_00215 [Candidatus Spechtbacteria bacterium RIFCSPLOWO2_01_FULL_38_20]|nr:MAG: hypothetical protein A3A00_00215 [Candidatus Spechtbacteria bacterium RIFCSPLOWO2_01_FULL_38_20]